jgi:tetratricopeptide (TPR) repeat protein
MSEAEAVDTLIKSAGMIGAVTQANREDAMAIAKELGYLPVAVVQAGSFIMQRRCMDMYLTYLKTNRHHVLNMPAKAQLDSHYHGIYAALDVTLPNLSQRSQMLLGVLACVNYTGFPVALIGRAARKNFLYERHDLLERSSEIQETAQFLDEIFKPDGHWHELMLDDLLVELEQYSLVTRIPNYSTMTLRFHRLVHAWMYDRISVHNLEKYQVAALRLLVCGTAEEDEDLYEHMSSHASALESTWKTGHVNDQAAMTTLLTWEGKKDVVIQIWEDINQKIMAIHGESHISRSRARLQLALSYGSSSWEQWRKTTTQIEHEVRLRTELCSRDHPATMEALLYLCEQKVQYQWLTDEDLALQKELILFWRNQDHDHDSNFTVKAMEVLAKMYRRLGQLEQAITVLTDVLGSRKRTRGDDHTTTIQTMELLAAFQLDPRRPTSKQMKRNKLKDILSSENLLRDIVVHRMSSQGPHHVDTLKAQTTLAEFYDKARLFEKAESIWRTVIEGWDTRPGINDRKSLNAMGSLAGAYIKQKRYQEATDIWTSIVQRIREKHGNEAKGTLDAMKSLARLLERQKRYAEACSLWVEVIAGHKKRSGVSGVTLRAMQSLAMARAKQGDNDAAILLWQQIILGLDALGQPYDEQKDKATESLAKLYEEEGRYGEAIASWKQIIKNHQSFGDNRARRARESLGNLYLKQTYSSEFSFKRKQVISTEDYLGRRGLPESGEVRRQRPLTNGRHVSTINNPTDKALESLAGLLAKREGTLHLREQRVETTARAQEPVQQNEVITVAVERIPNTEDIKKGWDGCTIQ